MKYSIVKCGDTSGWDVSCRLEAKYGRFNLQLEYIECELFARLRWRVEDKGKLVYGDEFPFVEPDKSIKKMISTLIPIVEHQLIALTSEITSRPASRNMKPLPSEIYSQIEALGDLNIFLCAVSRHKRIKPGAFNHLGECRIHKVPEGRGGHEIQA